MAKLTDDIKQKILADWKVGISQNQLAKKYLMSPATINKLCKGIEQSNVELVNAKVSVITALNEKNEYEVNSIDEEVNSRLRRSGLVYGILEGALKLSKENIARNATVEKIGVGAGVQNFEPRELRPEELKTYVDTAISAGKAWGIIEDKPLINNSNNQQNNTIDQKVVIFKKIKSSESN